MNAVEHEAALVRLADLMLTDPEPASPEGREICALVNEVISYEMIHHPLPPPA